MLRRTVLSGLAVALPTAVAGCTSSEQATPGTDTANGATETDTPPSSTVTTNHITATLIPRAKCPEPGAATVSFGDDGEISVVGCVVGKNACTVPRLQDTTYDADTGDVTVVVAAVEEREEDEACAEVLTNLGYEVDIETSGTAPTGVEVVHDDVDGRRTVADVTK
ncbi:hypothetical protein [Halobellus inordinatus]|uniref:hypothetical protein n=1 Tax=Halobellus inordinatus TaxID=1126236 RepID=UPI00210EE44F|nr:hypothetical protein [Halobellus inordinatus]